MSQSTCNLVQPRNTISANFTEALNAYQLAKILDPSIGTLEEWIDSLTGLPGAPVELQVSDTHIQWRYVGDETWTDIVPLTALGTIAVFQSATEPENPGEGFLWLNLTDGKLYVRSSGVWIDLASWASSGLQIGPGADDAAAGNHDHAGVYQPLFSDYSVVAGLANYPSEFPPSTHKSSHATGGDDALAPSDIGALPATGGTATNLTLAGTLTAGTLTTDATSKTNLRAAAGLSSFSETSEGSASVTASGTNQNVTLTPTGTGSVYLGTDAYVGRTSGKITARQFVDWDNRWAVVDSGLTNNAATPIRWSSDSNWQGSVDTGVSRISANQLAIGNGTAGDFSGGLKLTNLTVAGTTASTSTTTGCATFAGGVGVEKSINCGGLRAYDITYNEGGYNAIYHNGVNGIVQSTVGDLLLYSSSGITKATENFSVGGNLTASGTIKTTDTTASTSTTTGCATFAGGIGVVGAIFCGGAMTAASSVIGYEIESSTRVRASATSYFSCGARSRIYSPADSVFQLINNAVNDFDRLQLGGATSSFPAIKRNGTAINIRLADDSADAPLTASNIAASGTVKTVSYTNAAAVASSSATAVAAGDGAQAYISDLDKPVWSDGTVWKFADGTTLT